VAPLKRERLRRSPAREVRYRDVGKMSSCGAALELREQLGRA